MDGRVHRRTFPTAAFTLTVKLLAWIEAAAAARQISKSEFVREVLEEAMTVDERKAA